MTPTRDSLLRPSPRRYDQLEWIGGQVRIQSLTAGEMRRLRESFLDKKGNGIPERLSKQKQVLLCACIVDDAGTRIFSDEDASLPGWDDIDGGVLEAGYQRCQRLTGFLCDYDWKAIEGAAKNSEEIREQP